MAERKGGQGELVGVEDGEERREGEFVGRWVEDSGTESGEERKGVEEAMEQVKGALEKLASALPRLAGNVGGSVNDLVAKLQNCLTTPAPPPRKNKRKHHTVGVTPEEIARARKLVEKPQPIQLTRGEFKPLEHRAGCFIETQPQTATLSFNAPPGSNAPPLNYDPSVSLFTPAQSVQIAVHKAAIQKQISQEETKVRRTSLQRQISQEELRKKETDSESSSDEEISPARRLLKIASKRRTRIAKIKRSNTVEITRPATYCDSDTDDPAYGSDRSGLKRKSSGALYAQPPPFLPKTDNDLKFLDFLSKVSNSSSDVSSYNPSARGGKHWNNRFTKLKTSFEDQSSDEKEVIPKGKCSPFPQQKTYVQPKLPWSVKQEGDVVVGSLTVAKKAPGPVNQFTHAPMSPFKPVEKKTFPSSVSGSVKQLASQKFAPQSQQEIIKPIPSVPPRTHSKFQPLPGTDAPPLSQRFVPNKVSGAQHHPPAQAYVNQFSHYSPKDNSNSERNIPIKAPNKNVDQKPLVKADAHVKPSHPVSVNPVFKNGHSDSNDNSNKIPAQNRERRPKPEIPAKPILNYSNSVHLPIKPASKELKDNLPSKANSNLHKPNQQLTDNSLNYHQPLKQNTQNYEFPPDISLKKYHQPVVQGVQAVTSYPEIVSIPPKTVVDYPTPDYSNKSITNSFHPDEFSSISTGNHTDTTGVNFIEPVQNQSNPIPNYTQVILQIPDPMNQSSYSNYKELDIQVEDLSPKSLPCYNPSSQTLEPSYPNPNTLTVNCNNSWANETQSQPKDSLTVSQEGRDSESLSPYPYKGCYVYNENNEILATTPYSFSNNSNYPASGSSSYPEPIYQNILEVNSSPNYYPSNVLSKSAEPFQHPSNSLPINGISSPDKSTLPHLFAESGAIHPTNQGHNSISTNCEPLSGSNYGPNSYYNNNSVVFEPVNPPALSFHNDGNDTKNISNYYSDSGKGSHDSLNELNFQGISEYPSKASPYIVYNNCINSLRDSNEPLATFSPAYGNLSGGNSQGASPRGCDDWDNCIEEKAVVGRVMGEAQCQRATTQARRVESRFPNAPSSANLLRPPSDQTIKIPSPTLKSRQDHSPKALSPSFPNVLHKSESWHQMVKEQMNQAKQAPPIPAKVVKTKSSHTLAMPKQFEGALNPDSAHRLQKTVKQYLAKSPLQNATKKSQSDSMNEEVENVDEAFESLFQECSNKRNSK